MRRAIQPSALFLGAALLAGCREGSANDTSGFGITLEPVPSSEVGADGCNGPDHVFGAPPSAPQVVWSSPAIVSTSRLAAALDLPQLYVTLADGAVAELDFSAGDPPSFEEVLPAHLIRDQVLAPAGVAGDEVLSGIAVTSETNLVLMEHTGNVLIVARRDAPAFAAALGTPSALGGFLDGSVFSARFNFEAPGDACPTADGRILVVDTGNHVLREVESTDTGLFVATLAGTGQTTSDDGGILETAFDTPWGLQVDCAGRLLITERGDFGGGNRLRSVALGTDPFFDDQAVESTTLAGDGAALTLAGIDEDASLARPSPAVSTASGEIYWVDTLTGVLRRYDPDTGLSDCPLDVDCAAAQASTVFTPGGDFGLALDGSGGLFVLDCSAQALYRIP
jgi:hypothetical protein